MSLEGQKDAQELQRQQYHSEPLADGTDSTRKTDRHVHGNPGGPVDGPESGEDAVQEFDPATGKLKLKIHYKDGKWQDPASGGPAFEEFDPQTGRRTIAGHFQAGKLQDSAKGEPAWEVRNGQTGKLFMVYHAQNDVLQDSPSGKASEQRFDWDTGKQTDIWHRNAAGQFNDPASGVPAMQLFDGKTGNRVMSGHFYNGELQDAPSGEPARQEFDATTGMRTKYEHLHNSVPLDSASGDPAVQTFDPRTGQLLSATSYKIDGTVHELDRNELRDLAAKKAAQEQYQTRPTASAAAQAGDVSQLPSSLAKTASLSDRFASSANPEKSAPANTSQPLPSVTVNPKLAFAPAPQPGR
jgi:hypothetical protein